MKVEYSANNSGGYWWLSDDNWRALEAAGWQVDWDSAFLGAPANYAYKEFDSIDDARDEFATVTGQDPNEDGCDCCGPPHYFSEAR